MFLGVFSSEMWKYKNDPQRPFSSPGGYMCDKSRKALAQSQV